MGTRRIKQYSAVFFSLVAMEVFLVMNGMEIRAPVEEQERFMLSLAAGEVSREALTQWLRSNVTDLGAGS